ncbi:MAG: glycosyltransferase [Saprospiraceae bacterium]|nr:glycosyltransferase [Saprospiraceae bacterium]
MIKYSIIVAVYNRIGEVQELLSSAEQLDFDRQAFEILFVDDGSTDGFREMIKDYHSTSGLQVRAVYQTNQGPGAARNHGMEVATSQYFIFLDSDCMVPPEWLGNIDRQIEADHLDAFGGPDTFHPSFSPLLKAINYSMTSFLGTGGTRGSKKSIGKFYPRSFNMGLHRRVFEKIGGMNQLRHGQDMDFSARIYDGGFKVGLIPDAFVYHKRRTSLWKFFKQIFNWGVARINLGRLHPSLLKPVHFLPSLIIIGLVGLLIFSIGTGIWWIWMLVASGYVLVCVIAFVQSLIQYGEIKTALLSVITLNIQVFAYGFGLLSAAWQSLWHDEAKGFTKNYYGKK